jgi:hypothetical protein
MDWQLGVANATKAEFERFEIKRQATTKSIPANFGSNIRKSGQRTWQLLGHYEPER